MQKRAILEFVHLLSHSDTLHCFDVCVSAVGRDLGGHTCNVLLQIESGVVLCMGIHCRNGIAWDIIGTGMRAGMPRILHVAFILRFHL